LEIAMGYDCTFHVINEQAIRDRFVPKLLQRTDEQTELDRVMEESESLWEKARNALNGQHPDEPEEVASPELAASLICQLAVMFSSCSLPHHYERGLAFSLWDGLDLDGAGEFPQAFAFDPEALFNEVTEEYPALHGQFNRWFTGNYSTGVYVPAEHVPEVLAWLEDKVRALAKGERRPFKGLLAILHTAAARKLGFWEATDLAVPIMGTVPGDPGLMTAAYLQNLKGQPGHYVERAPVEGEVNTYDWSIAEGSLITADQGNWRTSCWDLTTWPPRQVHVVEEFAPYRTRFRDGRWLFFSSENAKEKPRVFRPRVLDADWSWKKVTPVVIDGMEASVSAGGFVGDKLIVFQPFDSHVGKSQSKLFRPPVMFENAGWILCPGLSPVEGRSLAGFIEDPVCAIAILADGTDLLLWDGDGYECRNSKFELTFPLAARRREPAWTSLPAGMDGLFYIAGRCLFEAHRGRLPVAHAPDWTNIMYLFPGPQGSIIVREGDNKDGDAAKLYFPQDHSFIHIEPELFDDNEYSFVYWSQPSDRFLVHYGKEWLSIRTSIVLDQPRFRVDSGAAI
jgi:hypothetical protein